MDIPEYGPYVLYETFTPNNTNGWLTHTDTLPASLLSNKQVKLYALFHYGGARHIKALDSIHFYLNGQRLAFGGSFEPLDDQFAAPCVCDVASNPQTHSPTGVNTKSGNQSLSIPALSARGTGAALEFGVNHQSMFAGDGGTQQAASAGTLTAGTSAAPTTALGAGWRHSYSDALTLSGPSSEPGLVIYEAATGNRFRFVENSDGTFTPFPGIRAALARDGSGYELTLRNNHVLRFDAQGRLTERVTEEGFSQILSYYSGTGQVWDGQLKDVTDVESGRTLHLSYTNVGGQPRLQSVTDPSGHSVQYGYTSGGDLQSFTDLRGQATTFGYAGSTHRIATVTNANSEQVLANEYDALGRVTRQTTPGGITTRYTYTTTLAGQATEITRSGPGLPADVRIDHYRPDGTLKYSERNGLLQGYATFDGQLTPTTLVDGNGHAQLLDNNAVGQPTQITDALGRVTTASYNPADHDLDQIVGADGITTTLSYHTNGLVEHITYDGGALQQSAHYEYTPDQLLNSVQGTDGVYTHYAYDTRGQLITSTLGLGTDQERATAYGYDAVGRIITTTITIGRPRPGVLDAYKPADTRTVTRYNPDGTVAEVVRNYVAGASPGRTDANVTTRYGYDALGRQVWVRDALGRYDVTHYDAAGRVDWTARNFVQAGWNGGPLPSSPPSFSTTAPDRNLVTAYGYDGLGRSVLVTQTGILTGAFDLATRRFAAATTRVTRTEYDALSRPVTVTLNYRPGAPVDTLPDVNLRTITYYDGAGNVTWQRDTLGRWTKTEYDQLGRVTKVIRNYEDGDPSDGVADTDLVSVTEYDARGRQSRMIDNYDDGSFVATAPLTDRVTLYGYDGLNRPISTTVNYDPPTLATRTDTNQTSETRYDPATGWVLANRDAQGRWTRYEYDAIGQRTRTIQNCENGTFAPESCVDYNPLWPDTNVPSQTVYDLFGRVVDVVDVYSIITRTHYDQLGRSVATIDNYQSTGEQNFQTNVTKRQAYDVLGRTSAMTDALGVATRYGYDALGRTTSTTAPDGKVTSQGYDGDGSVRWSATSDGRVTVTQVDGLGRVVASIGNYQNGTADAGESDRDLISRTGYDQGGRAVTRTDALGLVTAYEYDRRDLLTKVVENAVTGSCPEAPCNVTTRYTYDRAGNRTAITDANNHTRRFNYTALDQQQEAIDPLGHTTRYTYDRAGQLAVLDDPRGPDYRTTYGYDDLERLTSVTAGNSAMLAPIQRRYNAVGELVDLIDGSGTTSFNYDLVGRLNAVMRPDTGTVVYQHNARGERTRLIYPGSGEPVLDYTYDLSGRLSSVVQNGTALASYTYDATGRLSQLTRQNGAITTYGYDGSDRLRAQVTSHEGRTTAGFSYTVNRAGQRTAVAETYAANGAANAAVFQGATFEGDSLTDSINGVDQASGTITRDTSVPLKGAVSARFGGISNSKLTTFVGSNDSVYLSFYLRLEWLPAVTATLAQVVGGSTDLANLALNSDGTLTLRSGTTAISSPSVALTTNTIYRIGLRYTKGSGSNGVIAGFVARGDAAFGSAFAQSTSASSTTTATAVHVGTIGGNTLNATVDDMLVDFQAMPGPSSSRIKTMTFEAARVRNADSGADTTNGTVLVESSAPLKGLHSARISNQAGYVQEQFNGSDAVYLSFYLRLTSLPASTVRLASLGNGVSTVGNLTLSSNGTLTLRNGTTNLSGQASLSVGTLYRIGLMQVRGTGANNGTLAAFTATGDGAASFFATNSGQAVTIQATEARVGGTQAGQVVDLVLDDITLDGQAFSGPSASAPTRTVSYGYDPLGRLRSATESGSTTNTYGYGYDLAGNRTSVTRNGTTSTTTYNAANQVVGWSYDAAGNLRNDGTTLSTYDALGRMVARGSTSYRYSGDGVLLAQANGNTVISYTQDLAQPLPQILQSRQGAGRVSYLYGLDRLASVGNGLRTWEAHDALGSVRRTLSELGGTAAPILYDPWGVPTSGSVPTFGFTGELHDPSAGLVHLRARWYTPASGTFTARDPFAGFPERPSSLHPYQYAYSDPVQHTDPSGRDPWWVEPPRRPDNYFPTPYEAIEWQGRACAYAQIMDAPDVEQYCEPGPLTSLVVDATPVVGDVKGFVEVFTGCDLLTGEELGAWRWAGLLLLSELRSLGVGARAFAGQAATGAEAAAEIGIIVRPRNTLGSEDFGHFAVYTNIGGNIKIRGFWPQEDLLPSDLVNFLFENRTPGEIRDDLEMLQHIDLPGVVHARRPATVEQAQRLQHLLGEAGPVDAYYSFNPDNFPSTYNCVTWGCAQVREVIDPALAAPRQGRIKEALPLIAKLPAPWEVTVGQ